MWNGLITTRCALACTNEHIRTAAHGWACCNTPCLTTLGRIWRSRRRDKLKEQLNYLARIPKDANENIAISASAALRVRLVWLTKQVHVRNPQKSKNKDYPKNISSFVINCIRKEAPKRKEGNKMTSINDFAKPWFMSMKQKSKKADCRYHLFSEVIRHKNWFPNSFVWVILCDRNKWTTGISRSNTWVSLLKWF